MAPTLPPGTAPIKQEFLISLAPRDDIPDDDAAEGKTGSCRPDDASRGLTDSVGAEGSKMLSNAQRKKLAKEERKKHRGANKARRFQKVRDELDLCWRVASGAQCEFGEKCRFTHSIADYLAAKPRDIHFPDLSVDSPFIYLPDNGDATDTDAPAPVSEAPSGSATLAARFPSIDTTTTCPVFERTGECKQGFKCRFLGGHARASPALCVPPAPGTASQSQLAPATSELELELVTDEERKEKAAATETELNFISGESLKLIRTKKFPHPISDAYLKELEQQAADAATEELKRKAAAAMTVDVIVTDADTGTSTETAGAAAIAPSITPVTEPQAAQPEQETITQAASTSEDARHTQETRDESQYDTPDVQTRFAEKKRLNWKGLTYLAPLTTVGNLPFRRLCVDYGCDITCGEMALALSFLQASKEEWSLVRRHPSERIFGVQLAGSKPGLLVPAAETLAQTCGGALDFVDLNCGCPIDLVYKQGSGSALLDAAGKLGKIVVGMNKALGSIPVTVKLRTGVKDGRNNAHKLMPRLSTEFGAAAITLHGRTRQQRYTKLADWEYIRQCVEAVRAREAEEDLVPVPIFGGGDCFSAQDYWEKIDNTGVDGIMVGRGALIKPWIFTEIKERREWDISSRERLELVRKYAEYGLNHFGSDTAGVNTTRRYLCEALSFQYRYIPIGLLETLPGRINDRAPAFRGRDELETLLASPDSRDWVRISEMFLGHAPESWTFTPKHKSNAYGTEESQG